MLIMDALDCKIEQYLGAIRRLGISGIGVLAFTTL